MKPFIITVKGTTTKRKLKGGNKTYPKKYITAKQEFLPDIHTPILVSDPNLQKAFALFYNGYVDALQNEGIDFRNTIQKYFPLEKVRLIMKVAKDVL
jgi:hypothetical protein